LDRPSTDGHNDLSAFGKEAENWKPAVNKTSNRSIYFVDEGYSTMSPEDQSKFLKATGEHVKEHKAHLMVATHNEGYIEALGDDIEARLYHFEIKIDGNNIEFTYQLRDGPDDSRALEVARALGLPERIIGRAQRFLDGRSTAVTPNSKRKPPPIIRYTEEEREKLKEKTGDFLGFFPAGNVLDIVANQGDGFSKTQGVLAWRYAWPNQRDDGYGYGKKKTKIYPFVDPVFRLFSTDQDFSQFSPMRETDFGEIKNQDYFKKIQELLMGGPSRDSREVLERQRMFNALITSPERREAVKKALSEIEMLMIALMGRGGMSAEPKWDEFNLQFLESAVPQGHGFFEGSDQYKNELDFFLELLQMNLKITGLSQEDIGITEELEKIQAIISLYTEYNELSEESRKRMSDDRRGGKREQEDGMDWRTWYEVYKSKNDEIRRRLTEMTGEEIERDGLHPENFQKPLTVLAFAINTKAQEKIPKVSLFNKDIWNLLREEVERLFPLAEKDLERGMGLVANTHAIGIYYLRSLLSEENWTQRLVKELRSVDSVHLHQLSNYFEKVFGHWLGEITSGISYLESKLTLPDQIAEIERQIEDMEAFHQSLKPDSDEVLELLKQHPNELEEKIERIGALLRILERIILLN